MDGETRIINRHKSWWTQAEGLNALLLMHTLYPEDPADYYGLFTEMWEYIYRLHWAMGVRGYEYVPDMDHTDLIRKTKELGIHLLQIADNTPLHELDRQELEALSDLAGARRSIPPSRKKMWPPPCCA